MTNKNNINLTYEQLIHFAEYVRAGFENCRCMSPLKISGMIGRATAICPTCGKDNMLTLVFLADAGFKYKTAKGK